VVLKLTQAHLEAIIETKAMVEGLHIRVDDLTQVVLGNGDPEKGIIVRLSHIENFTGGLKRIVWLAVGSAVGSLVLMGFSLLNK